MHVWHSCLFRYSLVRDGLIFFLSCLWELYGCLATTLRNNFFATDSDYYTFFAADGLFLPLTTYSHFCVCVRGGCGYSKYNNSIEGYFYSPHDVCWLSLFFVVYFFTLMSAYLYWPPLIAFLGPFSAQIPSIWQSVCHSL